MASEAPPHPAILLHDAVALSGRFPLLAGVDLEVAVGETVLIEGPNGAGKTSLLRVCAGLVPVASGEATVLGLDPVHQRKQVRRRVGLLSHASHLYDDLTVRENVRFAVRAAGGDSDRIAGACDRWGLAGRLLKTSASKLSAGQRRRVALAVLTARWPELWLLDEPHAGLDASARDTLDRLIGDAGAAGITVLIASHETGFVESLADRAVTVTGGRITGGRTTGARSVAGPNARLDVRGVPAPGGVQTTDLDAGPGRGPDAGPEAGLETDPDTDPDSGRPTGEVAHVA
jgi:heme ABC exporter ATP-binding subunit CcmA